MAVRNRDGDPVDPVPFVVSAGLAAMLSLSLGPLYGQAYGVSIRLSLGVTVATTAALVTTAYYHLVWTAAPRSVSVPPAFQFQRVLYAAAALGVVLLALTVPLYL